MELFAVSCQHFCRKSLYLFGCQLLLCLAVSIEVIAFSELKEADVAPFAVHVVGNALQTSEEECLPHDVEVA